MSPRWEPNPGIRRGRTVVYNLHAHLVFVTKYRRDTMDDEMLTRCEEIMRKVCDDFGATLTEFNGEADHVHLLVHYPPKITLSGLVNSLKGVSARRLRAEFTGRVNRAIMHGHFWSPSYFAGSVGGAPLQVVKDYIEQQKRPD
ncbi:IS200/IS605 family transposase [Streptomyces sp. WMMB303]|uniref:IS200/IS605 family transposase n=1 Tax=Streptomyces sp. WMMB303 TaxID=3034154 RepID=UPI0023EAD810|nr:IS200/IS605 family transposase [Streptomyces sp. WMMB303]MDF4249937.1 IS200/IS605 family transposase [Streptomyces sp. WMMB303]